MSDTWHDYRERVGVTGRPAGRRTMGLRLDDRDRGGCGRQRQVDDRLPAGWELGWDFEDGDGLHSAASIAKMKAGHPLTDEDRRPWLGAVAAWID